MSTAAIDLGLMYRPTGLFAWLERLDLRDGADPQPHLSDPAGGVDWERIHAATQGGLNRLAERVRAEHPEIRAYPGRTSGRSFHLYSHMIFDLGPDEEIDEVVAGIDFQAGARGHEMVSCEIVGVGTGRIDYEGPRVEVPASQDSILEAATRLTRDLEDRSELVAQAVLARHAPPEY